MTEQYKMLDANHPVVKAIVAKEGIKPVKNGDAPVEVGSRQIVPQVSTPEKMKKVQISLTPEQQLLLIREGATKGMDLKTHLQDVVNEMLSGRIGRATISAPSYFGNPSGVKVTGPSSKYKGN